MLSDLLKNLQSKVKKETGYDAVIVTNPSAVLNIKTAYIFFPSDYNVQYCLSTDGIGTFTVNIDFVTHSCDATSIQTLVSNVDESMKSVTKILNKCIDRFLSSYHDEDMDASAYRYNISAQQWQTSGKILISTRLTLSYKVIAHVGQSEVQT